jgi:hypothetical protein
MPLLVPCLLVAALGAATAPAHAQSGGTDLLKALSGVWQGRGTVRQSPSAAAEPVSCRYEGALSGEGLALALSYVCLGVEFKFDVTGALTFDPASERFDVILTTAAANRRAEGSGKANGAGIDFDLTGRHPETGAQVTSQFSISLASADKLVNVLRSTDPETGKSFGVLQVTFSR